MGRWLLAIGSSLDCESHDANQEDRELAGDRGAAKEEEAFHSPCHLSKKKTKPEVARAPKRSNSDPPDSCGKEGDPHDLDRGKLGTDRIHLSAKSRRRLDNRYVGAGGLTIREAGLA